MGERPLVVTDDDAVLDEVLRIAAAAQVEVAHAPAAVARSVWRAASLVLVDAAAVPAVAAAGLPRRPQVVAVCGPDLDPVPWDACIRLGVDSTVRIGESDEALIALLADAVTAGGGEGRVVAVLGACGGAGASVFATGLAVAADVRQRRTLLADCDGWGAGLDVVLGVEDGGAFHWQDFAAPSGRLSMHDLRHALPVLPVGNRRISLLCHDRDRTGPVGPDVLDVVLRSGRRAGDLVVADLPRHSDAVVDVAVDRADLVVLVVPADVRGCYGAARMAARLDVLGCRPVLVVRGPSPGGLGADDVERAVGLPVLARMRPQPGLARDLEQGRPPGTDRRGPLARAAGTVLDRLDGRG
ncbi:septum site-determining protein Ssd [Nakamurella endophytica]|uniref:ATPase AAA n=1 Tax=Nakamurella endophytica TaxID=1748367 RepID=A0A917SZW1_9ACTN|nr:septum site-determining protein Ssd [Nakamurella endophytica]GGM05358.1 ATPase AAA [Nakamurella endophytica]